MTNLSFESLVNSGRCKASFDIRFDKNMFESLVNSGRCKAGLLYAVLL